MAEFLEELVASGAVTPMRRWVMGHRGSSGFAGAGVVRQRG